MPDLKPQIIVTLTPNKIHRGQMLSIQAYAQDRYTGVPITYPVLYMDIISEDGIPVWPLSAIEENSASISKLISTSDLKEGQDYLVRISPNRNLSPSGSAMFHIDHELLDPALLVPGFMLIPHLLLSTPDSTKKEKTQSDVVGPDGPIQIAWLIYRTQLDSKVCRICKPNEGLRFRPDDPDLIKIPEDTHPRCRCVYDVISKYEEKQIYEAYLSRYYEMQLQENQYQAVAAAYFAYNQ